MGSIIIEIPEGYEIDKENSTSEEIKLIKKEQEFEYVDLGLPSGTLWATCNVGAEKSEEYGKLLQYDDAIDKYELPTLDQIKELIEFCDWKYVSYKGVNGCLVIGTTGKSIFLPSAGCHTGTSFYYEGLWGYYWSRTLSTNNPHHAYYLHFDWNHIGTSYVNSRYNGQSVRPVKNK